MILKTDILTLNDFLDSVPEDCSIIDITETGTRLRIRAYAVRLAGSSKYAPRNMPGYKTATYDEWGEFLANLYELDEHMICGSVYKDQNDFIKKTKGVFS